MKSIFDTKIALFFYHNFLILFIKRVRDDNTYDSKTRQNDHNIPVSNLVIPIINTSSTKVNKI